ncbi:unnamed protein product [Parnassius apollo]|uniref:(apollo) hypothetical protein n=1 Tax=Parnassius apollo TaxID=110799 RepID=A0A8S3XYH8_PARAO|nr:unnamed protein product [Parnassius apollo]
MDRSTKAIVRHRINNIIFEAETGCRVDMFSDFSRPSSAHSHPGYYKTAATPPTNYSTPTADTLPTNYSTPVYSEYSNQLNANPQTVPPLETLDVEDAGANP